MRGAGGARGRDRNYTTTNSLSHILHVSVFQNGAFLTFLNAKATLGKLKQDLSLTEPFNIGRGQSGLQKQTNIFFFKMSTWETVVKTSHK